MQDMTERAGEGPPPRGERRPGPARDDEPVLPDRPERERDEAWGDSSGRRDEDWYRRERPPHHE